MKAKYAENQHAIRVCDQALARHMLRLRFLHRLEPRIGEPGPAVVPDVPQLIGSELQEFLREPGDSSLDARRLLQAEMDALRNQLASIRDATQFVQGPSTVRVEGAAEAPPQVDCPRRLGRALLRHGGLRD